MDGKGIIAVVVSFAVSLGLLYVVDTYLFKTASDIVQNLIKIVLVLAVVGIAGWITQKIVHKQGVDIKVDGIKN